LWSAGRYDLRLSEAEFWRITLREFDALMRRHVMAIDREDGRVAIQTALIRADIANSVRGPKDKAVKAEDLLLDKYGGKVKSKPRAPVKKQTWQDMKQLAMHANATLGGTIDGNKN